MRFEYSKIETLPRLAWCARIGRGRDAVRVEHGPWVETHDRFFFEGAWGGEFSGGDPAGATACLGSGASLADGGVLFSTPTHMLERLHAARAGDELLVSNSLAFVLEQLGDSCDPEYKFYHFDLMSNMKGLRKYKRSIRTRGGNRVRLYHHCNFLVRPDLSVGESPKRLPREFKSFDDYAGFLLETTKAVHRNATAPGRKVSYPPLATISSGYDSPACALFAQAGGCGEAVTFTEARPGYESSDDSGSDIARLLGLEVSEFERETYLRLPDFPEAEFLACGAGGEEVVFATLEKKLEGRLFFTGYLGDAVWGRSVRNVNRELRMLYPGGSSFGEFRLRVGFVHLPLPAVGYVRHPSINAISNSAEMAPWAVGGDYDRPIPRRLLEERGVARDLFGQHKMAITQPLWNTERLDLFLTRESYSDLKKFAGTTELFRNKLEKLRFDFMRGAYRANLRVNWKLDAVAGRFGMHKAEQPVVSERYSQPLGLSALTFHWGINKVQPRYKY
jgi:hypothetical protein